ncbi:MFS transporter [Streptococcus sp. S784/96/1]|uniref:MFS transporter n=1 Tax=Streptococcus sp. S784/96/1 TaxID=2653499 RepID=UPI001387032E|nr:MFS transporter [Streptococcus sp. S784/96/1]
MSNFLNNLGSAIYNLVFVIYVAEVYHSKTMLFIANNIMMLPIYFQIFVGFQSDKTKNKSRALLISGYVQALLFIGVAWLTQNATFVTFSLICLINVISDMLALYSSNLRLPLFKRFLGEEELREAFSFNHFVRILSNIGGQFLGVWLLTISHNNYGLVAFLNALTFFLSTVLLIGIFKDYDSLVEKEAQNSQEEPEKSKKQSLKGAWKVLQGAFETVGSGISVKRLLLAWTLQFTLAGAENVMFNMYFLSHPIGILSYEQILIALNLVSTAGLVAGDLTPND